MYRMKSIKRKRTYRGHFHWKGEDVERCDECGATMRFLIEDEELLTDFHGREVAVKYGIWQCPRCGYEEFGSL